MSPKKVFKELTLRNLSEMLKIAICLAIIYLIIWFSINFRVENITTSKELFKKLLRNF